MPSDMTRPSPTIRPFCCSITPPHKRFSSSEARHLWHVDRGNRLWTMQTKYIIFLPRRSILLIHHHQVIALDPTSPRGYEIKRTILQNAGEYDSAVDALEEMLSKIVQSPDPDVQGELYPHCHDKVVNITLQSSPTGTSTHRVYEQQSAKLFNGRYVIYHMWSSTPPPAASTVGLSRHLYSNPCQSSKNLYHQW